MGCKSLQACILFWFGVLALQVCVAVCLFVSVCRGKYLTLYCAPPGFQQEPAAHEEVLAWQ